MALHPHKNEHAPFVMTDNVAGYFEGRNFAHDGAAGYRYRDTVLLQDCAGFVHEQRSDRRVAAQQMHVLPFAVQYDYADFDETLLLHSGRAVVSCRVRAKQAARLSIAAIDLFAQQHQREQDGAISVFKLTATVDDAVPRYVAVSASQAVRLHSSTSGELIWQSVSDSQELWLHFAFANTAVAAKKLATSLIHENVWKSESAKHFARLTTSYLWTNDEHYNRALLWARASAQSFVVNEFGRGIWAGLPWFRDNWGRDTFIVLPGTLLVNGQFATAKEVLDNFLRWQKTSDKSSPLYGRIPNRVAANTDTIYNTADGTPWLIRELYEYARYSGDRDYALAQLPRIDAFIEGVQKHWLDADGLLTHEDADSWMDARILGNEAWSPRGNRAIDIQALWFTVLTVAADLHRHAGHLGIATTYQQMATRTRDAVDARFWQQNYLADRLRADNTPDATVRPNQIMAITIPFSPMLTSEKAARLLHTTSRQLVLPYGVLSLSPAHRAFHPKHENPALHHKDAAYHNGTIWGWNAGFVITAFNRYGRQDLSWMLTQNLADQILKQGTRGTMSELLDATLDERGNVNPSGTFAQAWSVAEFSRNAMQDFLGFHPDLLQQKIILQPALPLQWSSMRARVLYGNERRITLSFRQDGGVQTWQMQSDTDDVIPIDMALMTPDGRRHWLTFSLNSSVSVMWNGNAATLNGKAVTPRTEPSPWREVAMDIQFAPVPGRDPKHYPVLKSKDVLQRWIIAGEHVF